MKVEGLGLRVYGLSPYPNPSGLLIARPMRVFYFNLFISIALIVGGFLLPPTGIIDGSVLTAVGELLMFGVIAQIPRILDAVRNGKSFKFQK